jgi:hypothetical protein
VRDERPLTLTAIARDGDAQDGPDDRRAAYLVAAYYDLTGDELAERIPVHRLELLANDPSISRLPVLTVPALDPG